MELFSVSIHSYNAGDAFHLYGSIECSDSFLNYEIFERDETKPEIVYPNETLSLAEPARRCYECPHFRIFLDLKDAAAAAEGSEMCSGFLSWNDKTFSYWEDMRVCSVISWKKGFAAVHYTIFSYALQATPKIILRSCHCEVRGRIRARYCSYRYNTDYEENTTRVRFLLFVEEEFVKLGDGDVELPLSRYDVALPRGARLIVEAELLVRLSDNHVEELRGLAEYL